jgi:hypothetical protein
VNVEEKFRKNIKVRNKGRKWEIKFFREKVKFWGKKNAALLIDTYVITVKLFIIKLMITIIKFFNKKKLLVVLLETNVAKVKLFVTE